jgi:predicted Rossmann fold flavoprotein
MCGITAAQRGRNVAVLDHGRTLGGKILISGGGRCNFTNMGASPKQYVSENPDFCRSALSRYTPQDFIEWVQRHDIAFHEKTLGQLFCDDSARDIVNMLEKECAASGVRLEMTTEVHKIVRNEAGRYKVSTSKGDFESHSLVLATGGLSFPKLGATGFGYEIAKQFGLRVVGCEPALDGFVFAGPEMAFLNGAQGPSLAGVALDVEMRCTDSPVFREAILFTHTGLSGPAALQTSLHWRSGMSVEIDFAPGQDVADKLKKEKRAGNKQLVHNVLSGIIPARLAERLCEVGATGRLQDASDAHLDALAKSLHHWRWIPARTVGYSKAEVTRGGVDTRELSSKTMEARRVPGLYFIGEVVDVTGWLGGYNFQWAWASGWAAGQVV